MKLRLLALASYVLLSCVSTAQRLTDFPAITGSAVDPAADLLLLNDTSAGTAGSKKITLAELVNVSSFTNGNFLAANSIEFAQVNGLQAALDAKQATLVSATNIKTINGSSLLGSGNLALTSDLTAGPVRSTSGTSTIAADQITPTMLATGIPHTKLTGLGTAATKSAIYLNVRDAPYNAVGDGVADDRAAIQAAIDATLVAGASKIVFLPAGTYKITSPLLIRGMGMSIVGVSAYTTIIKQTAVNQHGIRIGNTEETRHMRVSGLKIEGPGADTTTGSGIYAAMDDAGPIGSQLLVEDFQITGFANGIFAQEMPRLAVRDGLFYNNIVGLRLPKADTFICHNVGMGAPTVAAETWGYIIGTATLANFAGEIQLGEYGDLDHFMLLTRGKIAVADVNLERIGGAGGYITKIDSDLASLSWSGCRINSATLSGGDLDTGAVFRLIMTNSDRGATLIFPMPPRIESTGWRDIEVVGTYAYNANVLGLSNENAPFVVWSSTEGGSAIVKTRLGNSQIKNTDAQFSSDATRHGYQIFQAAQGGSNDRDLRNIRTSMGTFLSADRINRNLLDVLHDTSTAVSNTTTTETALLNYVLPANYFTSVDQTIRITAFGKFAANANNKNITLSIGGSFGGTAVVYDSTALAINGNDWSLDCLVTRASGSTFHSRVIAGCDDPLFTKKLTVTKALAGYANQATTFAIKATGVATGDIELIYGQVYFMRNDSSL